AEFGARLLAILVAGAWPQRLAGAERDAVAGGLRAGRTGARWSLVLQVWKRDRDRPAAHAAPQRDARSVAHSEAAQRALRHSPRLRCCGRSQPADRTTSHHGRRNHVAVPATGSARAGSSTIILKPATSWFGPSAITPNDVKTARSESATCYLSLVIVGPIE